MLFLGPYKKAYKLDVRLATDVDSIDTFDVVGMSELSFDAEPDLATKATGTGLQGSVDLLAVARRVKQSLASKSGAVASTAGCNGIGKGKGKGRPGKGSEGAASSAATANASPAEGGVDEEQSDLEQGELERYLEEVMDEYDARDQEFLEAIRNDGRVKHVDVELPPDPVVPTVVPVHLALRSISWNDHLAACKLMDRSHLLEEGETIQKRGLSGTCTDPRGIPNPVPPPPPHPWETVFMSKCKAC